MNVFRQTLKQIVASERLIGSFKFKRHRSANLGEVFRPEIEVQIWSEVHAEWQRYSMLIDTGADYTILPRYVASLLGVSLQKIKAKETMGLGGQQKVFLVPELKIKIGKAERVIPVGFVDNNQIPLLLGRHQALETFVILLRQKQDIFFAE